LLNSSETKRRTKFLQKAGINSHEKYEILNKLRALRYTIKTCTCMIWSLLDWEIISSPEYNKY